MSEAQGDIKAIQDLLTALVAAVRPTDKVCIVVLGESPREIHPFTPAGERPAVRRAIQSLRPDGSHQRRGTDNSRSEGRAPRWLDGRSVVVAHVIPSLLSGGSLRDDDPGMVRPATAKRERSR